MENDGEATTSQPPEPGRGAGGKMRRPPNRNPRATPYARPNSNKPPAAGGGSGCWLWKLVDPAYRLISGSATRILHSLFSRSPSPASLPSLPDDDKDDVDPTMEKGMNPRASSCEVFLSFRGADTRYDFTDFLYHDMVDAGILVFRDSESLHVGEEIGGELLRAIENSKIYIPILSTNYASSHWCLRELACMVKCTSKSNGKKEILPIFLDVEPADIKLKTNLYKETLSKHRKTLCTEVKSWEKALIEVGKIKGWNWKKDESQADLVQSITQIVLARLNMRSKKYVTENLVGVEDRVKVLIEMLDVGSNSVQFLGIHGMGGIGKTTLAKIIFNQLFSDFQGWNFLSDVRESSQRHGLVYLQKQLVSNFLHPRYIDQIHDPDDGINMIKRVFCDKKVLIVLDDVDGREQLKNLAAKGNWFGPGSRIIITTRDQSVLLNAEEVIGEELVKKSANVLTYEVQGMEFDDAFKLLSRHAFRRDSPPDHYVSLSEKVVSTLGMLPLALEVTGSSLNGKSKKFWEDTLEKLKDAPPYEVQRSLEITYERLDDGQKQVFLDIACFFVNKDKTYPFYMWHACQYHPHDALEVLFLLSLAKIKDDNTFWMHDQVRDLGRVIVRRENFKDPCQRSRVWNHEEALSILKRKEGSRKIEALSVGDRGDSVTHDEVANLQNLRFFKGNGVSLVGDFNNLLSNLRWLSWHHCPSDFLATNFSLTNLVILDLSWSNISEEWIGWNQVREANKLKVLDLSYCKYLKRTPDLSTWVFLERLIFKGCRQLIEIDPYIGKLKHLTTLDLEDCESLQELPKEIGCLQALTQIVFYGKLQEEFKLPVTFGDLNSLLIFDASGVSITKLPYSIGGLVKLRRLTLCHSTHLKELPDSIGKLQSLVELDLSWTSISHLPDSIGNLKHLTVLRMSRLRGITKLPSSIGLVEKLEELDLSFTSISELPTTVSHLSNLLTLNLAPCPKLKQLPGLPPRLTCLRWTHDSPFVYCTDMPCELESVTVLPTSISTLYHLERLTLSCKTVQFLPQLPSSLRKLRLQHLTLTQSSDFSNLKNLSTMEFFDCSMLGFSGIFDAELEIFHMQRCKFREVDALFQLEMDRLRSLKMLSCEFLNEIIDLSCMKNLQEVALIHCHSLVEIRGLEELGSLCSLCILDCRSLERISDRLKLEKQRKLRVDDCPKLRR